MNAVRLDKAKSPHERLLQEVEDLVQKQDLFLVKILATKAQVIEIEYGASQAAQAIKELQTSL